MGAVMKRMLLALTSGCLFGGGLLISGMTDTAKVQGWLDILGAWDPTLAFVMGGAIIPMAVAWRYSKNKAPFFAENFPTPASQKVSRDLIAGSVLFGMGWAIAGLCPGPAVRCTWFWRKRRKYIFCFNVDWHARCQAYSQKKPICFRSLDYSCYAYRQDE
jgi:uncharacterized membrane protein YedE/YeeE